jgi:hypothetical protein
MIKQNNYRSIRRLFTFIFLFSGIIACSLSPCRVFASGSANPAINTANEELATFDEAENSTLDSAPATGASSLLHPEHYQPSVYFSERQNRSVTSSGVWFRVIPFAVLIVLALVTTRWFGRRRRKDIVAGNCEAFDNIPLIIIGTFLIISMTSGLSYAQRGGFPGQGGFQGPGGFGQSGISISTKEGVASLLGDGEIYQKEIELTASAKKTLKEKLSWEPQESSIKVYYSKTKDGAVEAYAFVLSEILEKCGTTHKYCIKVSSKGQVEGVKILELNCHHAFGINSDIFLNQFKSMNTTNADTVRIDGVTRATLSANLTYWVVRRAMVLFDVMKVAPNA